MPTYLRAVVVMALCLTTICSYAESANVEERLARLESAIARLEARLGDTVSAEELAPTLKELSDLSRQLGYDGKTPFVVAKVAGKEQKLSIGGYLHLQGETGKAPDARYTGISDRFLVRRARLTIKGTFAENFEFTAQPDFGNNSISATTGYRAQLADLYAAWTKYPFANVQLGQFKTPFGYEQLMADTKTPLIERSLPNDRITFGRQTGLGLTGTLVDKKLTYAAGLFNGNGTNNGGNDNDHMMSVARLAGTLWSDAQGSLNLGANLLHTRDNGTFNGRRDAWGVDAQFAYGNFSLAAEYLYLKSDAFTGTDTEAEGWSAVASWFFIPKLWQAVVRYESYDANQLVGDNLNRTWVFGLNYCVKGDDLRLSLNYMVGDPAGSLKNQDRLLGRLQLIF